MFSRFSFLIIAAAMLFSVTQAHAVPGTMVYRSDKLKTSVYRDGSDSSVYWYLPPVKLYADEASGKVIYYKKKKGAMTDYYFYIVAYMNDDLVKFLAGEIKGIVDRTQLRPVMVKKFGLQIPQFNVLAASEEVTDYQYINAPQLIKMSFNNDDTKEFEFFLNNLPGIQTNVVFSFTAEKKDKWLKLELTHNDVYKAMGIGAKGAYSGKYVFTRAQIEANMRKYISNKTLNITGKGDLPIPDIVNEVIRQCFTPISNSIPNNDNGGYYPYPGGDSSWPPGGSNTNDPPFPYGNDGTSGSSEVPTNVGGGNGGINPQVFENFKLVNSALQTPDGDKGTGTEIPGDTGGDTGTGNDTGNDTGTGNGNGGEYPTKPPGNTQKVALGFEFKMELAQSNQKLSFSDSRYTDSAEITSVPVYLTTIPAISAKSQKANAYSLGTKTFVVPETASKTNVFHSGIIVKEDEQYTIDATFAISAQSPYVKKRTWFKSDIAGHSTTANLYYRIGTGQWIAVDAEKPFDGRAVIRSTTIETGELQFYIDRNAIWSSIRSDFTKGKLGGVVPPIFTYKTTYPQFNLQISGRRFEFVK